MYGKFHLQPASKWYGSAIGQLEGLDGRTQEILEIEGPGEARKLLDGVCNDRETVKRVCWLIAHHHTYSDIQDMDHQILVEVDFLVNLSEDHASIQAVRHTLDTIFRTKAGISFLKSLWELNC